MSIFLNRKQQNIRTQPLVRLQLALQETDAVVIGAGAGLSTSAGFTYDGPRFEEYFSDFRQKYGFQDMYTGGFFPFASPEEYWAYWSRYIWVNRYLDPPKPVYETLLELVQDKDYFVLTTNVDHCFQKAGFDKKRLFYTQGDYGLFQCSEPCCQETWDNEKTIRIMMAEQKDMRIPSEQIPRCPRCGKPFTMNLRSDDKFVQDKGWYQAANCYEDYLRQHQNEKILYLELGVGYNTPVIIKYPFWEMTLQNREAIYACINRRQAFVPKELQRQAICMNEDIGQVLQAMLDTRDCRFLSASPARGTTFHASIRCSQRQYFYPHLPRGGRPTPKAGC